MPRGFLRTLVLVGDPDIDQLLAYRDRTFTPEEDKRFKRHLLGCPSCASALLDIERFPDVLPFDGAPPVSQQRIAAGWSVLHDCLGANPKRV